MTVAGCQKSDTACAIPPADDPEVCADPNVVCDLPAQTGDWPAGEGSDGAVLPEGFVLPYDLTFGMGPREACDALAAFTLRGVETYTVPGPARA